MELSKFEHNAYFINSLKDLGRAIISLSKQLLLVCKKKKEKKECERKEKQKGRKAPPPIAFLLVLETCVCCPSVKTKPNFVSCLDESVPPT